MLARLIYLRGARIGQAMAKCNINPHEEGSWTSAPITTQCAKVKPPLWCAICQFHAYVCGMDRKYRKGKRQKGYGKG